MTIPLLNLKMVFEHYLIVTRSHFTLTTPLIEICKKRNSGYVYTK